MGKKCKVISKFLGGKARNLLCKSSGMSFLVAFYCKLEKPIRGSDLKVIEKNVVLSNRASAVSNGAQVKLSIEPT